MAKRSHANTKDLSMVNCIKDRNYRILEHKKIKDRWRKYYNKIIQRKTKGCKLETCIPDCGRRT